MICRKLVSSKDMQIIIIVAFLLGGGKSGVSTLEGVEASENSSRPRES